jgi:hypothetical protein
MYLVQPVFANVILNAIIVISDDEDYPVKTEDDDDVYIYISPTHTHTPPGLDPWEIRPPKDEEIEDAEEGDSGDDDMDDMDDASDMDGDDEARPPCLEFRRRARHDWNAPNKEIWVGYPGTKSARYLKENLIDHVFHLHPVRLFFGPKERANGRSYVIVKFNTEAG